MNSEITKLILESNLINFTLVALALTWVLIKFVPDASKKQAELIRKEIKEAQESRKIAEKKLEELEAKLNDSKLEAKKFLEEARSTSKKIREQILNETKAEIKQMQEIAEKDLEQQKDLIMRSIKAKVIDAAFALTEESIKSETNRSQIEESLKRSLEKTLGEIKL